MQLFIIRHAESLGNIGQHKTPNDGLSPLGFKQAERIPRYFANIPLTHLFCSPFTRVIQTALPLAGTACLPITLVPELSEIFDNEERRDFTWMSASEIEDTFPDASFIPAYDRGTPWWPAWPEREEHEVRERVTLFYERDLLPLLKSNASVAVFGHGATTWQLKNIVWPEDRTAQHGNAVIHHYAFDSNGVCQHHRIVEEHLNE